MADITVPSKNTERLYDMRNRVSELRDMTYRIISDRTDSVLDTNTPTGSPFIRYLREMIVGMENCNNADHYLVVVNNVFTALKEAEDSISAFTHDDLNQICGVLNVVSAFNAQATLMQVNQLLTDSECALDDGINRAVHSDTLNSAISRLVQTEAAISTFEEKLGAQDTPPKQRHKF